MTIFPEAIMSDFQLSLDRLQNSTYEEDKIQALEEILNVVIRMPAILNPEHFETIFESVFELENREYLYYVMRTILLIKTDEFNSIITNSLIKKLMKAEKYLIVEFVEMMNLEMLNMKLTECPDFALVVVEMAQFNFYNFVGRFIGLSKAFDDSICMRGFLEAIVGNIKGNKSIDENFVILKKILSGSDIAYFLFITNHLYKQILVYDDYQMHVLLLKFSNSKIRSRLNTKKRILHAMKTRKFEFLFKLFQNNLNEFKSAMKLLDIEEIALSVECDIYAANLLGLFLKTESVKEIKNKNSLVTQILMKLFDLNNNDQFSFVLEQSFGLLEILYLIFCVSDISNYVDTLKIQFRKFSIYCDINNDIFLFILLLFQLHSVDTSYKTFEILIILKQLRKKISSQEYFSETITEYLMLSVCDIIKELENLVLLPNEAKDLTTESCCDSLSMEEPEREDVNKEDNSSSNNSIFDYHSLKKLNESVKSILGFFNTKSTLPVNNHSKDNSKETDTE